MLFQLPRECRVFTKLNPVAQWGWSEVLANKANYLLEILIWQNATPHKKGERLRHKQNKPKPFVPDFMESKEPPSEISKDSKAMPVDDIRTWLDLPRQGD